MFTVTDVGSNRLWQKHYRLIHRARYKSTKNLHVQTEPYMLLNNYIYNNLLLPNFSRWVWVCSVPSAQQACRPFFRVIYVVNLLKGPQSTTTVDTLTHTRFSVLSLILFVNYNMFYETEIWCCLTYSNNQWKIQR